MRLTPRWVHAFCICGVVVLVSGVSHSDDGAPTVARAPASPPSPPPPDPTSPRDSATPIQAPPLARAPDSPRIAFDRTEHDFGSARQRETQTTRFIARNTGGATLHVSARGDCGCTGVSISAKDATSGEAGTPSREIAPGDEASIWVTLGTSRSVGILRKSIHVTSDDPANPSTVLTIQVDVSAGVLLTPQGFFFGRVLAGTRPESTIEAKWKEGVGRAFRITSVEATDLDPPVAQPHFDIERFDAPPWHGYRVRMLFPDCPSLGAMTGSALIHTDAPDDASLLAPVAGVVSGRVVVSAMKSSFGVVRQGQRRAFPIHVYGFDASVDLGHVTAASRGGAVRVNVRKGDDSGMRGVWILEVELPEDAPVGPIDDVVDLATEVKGEEELELSIGGMVIAK